MCQIECCDVRDEIFRTIYLVAAARRNDHATGEADKRG